MRIALDTSPDAEAYQLATYHRMGGAGRVQVMFRMSALARQAAEAGIRSRHPQYDDGQVMRARARLLHGDDLVERAWPDHELLEP